MSCEFHPGSSLLLDELLKARSRSFGCLVPLLVGTGSLRREVRLAHLTFVALAAGVLHRNLKQASLAEVEQRVLDEVHVLGLEQGGFL